MLLNTWNLYLQLLEITIIEESKIATNMFEIYQITRMKHSNRCTVSAEMYQHFTLLYANATELYNEAIVINFCVRCQSRAAVGSTAIIDGKIVKSICMQQ